MNRSDDRLVDSLDDSTKSYAPGASKLVAGRYALLDLLGAGGGGQVYRATDLLAERTVALKLLAADVADAEMRRARREVGALAQLRMPGVVQLLDYGLHGDPPYIAMEVLDGTRFPGDRARDWESVRVPSEALLETLARVHATGILHRDLKPSNVLVDDSGRPTILDFGLTWGPSLGQRFTSIGHVVGTPHCLAPEQLSNGALDVRTDLYAVGVMLYETLSGRLPHNAPNVQELFRAKLVQRPEPLARLVPDLPAHVARVIDALLSIDPDQRPASAAATLRELTGDASARSVLRLPRIGQKEAYAQVLGAIAAGHSIDVVGAAGMGRSRMLTDVAEAVGAAGREVIWTSAIATSGGGQPFASIESALHAVGADLKTFAQSDLDGVVTLAAQALAPRLRDGAVLLVDDHDGIDRWSAQVIEDLRKGGCVVRAITEPMTVASDDSGPDRVQLEALTELELRDLFAGPDLLLHLREDPAAELFRRTHGVPGRVVDELAAWLRWDLARWEDDKVRVDRLDIDRLRAGLAMSPLALRVDVATPQLDSFHDDLLAWVQLAAPGIDLPGLAQVTRLPAWQVEAGAHVLTDKGVARAHEDGRLEALRPAAALQSWSISQREQAHRALAEWSPVGAPGRLLHVVAAGWAAEVTTEVRAVVQAHVDSGRLGEALAAIHEGLLAVRAHNDLESEAFILSEWVKVAMSQATAEALGRVLRELHNSQVPAAILNPLRELVTGAIEARVERPGLARDRMQQLPPFEDPLLEIWRLGNWLQDAVRISVDEEKVVLQHLESFVERVGDEAHVATLAMWKGLIEYQQGNFADAAELHLTATARRTRLIPVVSSLLNAASALLEVPDLDRSEELGERALQLLQSTRHPFYEARARWVLRAVRYRRDDDCAVDREFVAAVRRLSSPLLEAPISLNEAALAWRRGDSPLALTLATRAADLWRDAKMEWPARVAAALALACTPAPDEGVAEGLCNGAVDAPVPALAAQALGLVALALPQWRERLAEPLRQLAESIPAGERAHRREVLAIEEAMKVVDS